MPHIPWQSVNRRFTSVGQWATLKNSVDKPGTPRLSFNGADDEALAATVERGNRIRATRRECQRLEAKLRKELQFNRKVEINAELRQRMAELDDLQRVGNPLN